MKKLTKLLLVLGIVLFSLNVNAHEPMNNEKSGVETWMTVPFHTNIAGVVSSGNTMEYGNYVILDTEEIYYFQGEEYEVFDILYDNPQGNMKIAVDGKKYIAYTDEFLAFYECTRHGFGVRRILFNNPTIRDQYNQNAFSQQTILCSAKKIENIEALGLIAVYIPKLK